MSSALRDKFIRDGYLGPFRAIDEGDAQTMAQAVMPALKSQAFSAISRRNRHFDIDEVQQLAVNPSIVDLLCEIYDPDLLLWRSHVFTGKKGSGLGWHSDYFRTLLDDPLDHLTVHFAITDAPQDNCLMVVPGSHKWSLDEKQAAGFELIGNTINTGYGTPYFVRTIDRPDIQKVPLRAGEFFVFNPGLLHCSIDRMNDTSNSNFALSSAKKLAKKGLSSLGKFGLVSDPSRLAIGLRYCNPRNTISPKAFRETLSMGHRPVLLAGNGSEAGGASLADWRKMVTLQPEELGK